MKTDISALKTDVSSLKEDTAILKEESSITRTAVNKLLDWADDASIQIVPLFKRRNNSLSGTSFPAFIFASVFHSGGKASAKRPINRREKRRKRSK